MKRRIREISVFSLSAIDLFCSGMGAVMVVMVILMPYYLRPETAGLAEELAAARADIEALETADGAAAALAAARAELEAMAGARAEAEAAAREARARAEALEGRLAAPFLAVIISWDSKDDDVDLHVIDPAGNRFYFDQRRHRGTPAYIEVDSIRGPGNEVWIHPAASPGVYRVEYVFYEDRPPLGSVNVRGVAIFQGGRLEFPRRTIARADPRTPHLAVEILVSARGEVSIR